MRGVEVQGARNGKRERERERKRERKEMQTSRSASVVCTNPWNSHKHTGTDAHTTTRTHARTLAPTHIIPKHKNALTHRWSFFDVRRSCGVEFRTAAVIHKIGSRNRLKWEMLSIEGDGAPEELLSEFVGRTVGYRVALIPKVNAIAV